VVSGLKSEEHFTVLFGEYMDFEIKASIESFQMKECSICMDMKLNQNFTAVFEKAENGFIAYIEELPGVNTQGDNLDEARTNLMEALEMVISVRREILSY
jgi:predicted RNase H-like HicB family nuclease